jgi:transcription termination factor Rho
MPLDPGSLRSQPIADLVQLARGFQIENPSSLRKPDLVAALVRESGGSSVTDGSGVLEILPDGFGFLRAPEYAFLPGPDDIYVSPSQIRRFNLRNGDLVRGQIRAPKENERYVALIKVEQVNGLDAEAARDKVLFENLTPVWPTRRLRLGDADAVVKPLDTFTPMGFGQRAIIVGPPRSGRTTVLRSLAQALAAQHPEATLVVALLAERPEEVTEVQRAVKAIHVATTFDEPDARHVQVADMAIERAKRLVELRQDVIVLVDSLTRLARAAQTVVPSTGRTLPGGLDVAAAQRVRRFLGAARAVEEGGSLTVIGVVDAAEASEADASLATELRGAANLEIHLAAPSGVGLHEPFPCIIPSRSATLREELLLAPAELTRARSERAALNGVRKSLDNHSATGN